MNNIGWNIKGRQLISECGLYTCVPKIWPEIIEGDLLTPYWWYNNGCRPIGELMSSESAKELCNKHSNWWNLKAKKGFK